VTPVILTVRLYNLFVPVNPAELIVLLPLPVKVTVDVPQLKTPPSAMVINVPVVPLRARVKVLRLNAPETPIERFPAVHPEAKEKVPLVMLNVLVAMTPTVALVDFVPVPEEVKL